MKVEHIPCGEFANESERDAIELLKSRLSPRPSRAPWFLLTNVPNSITVSSTPDEIDLIAVGPTGVFPIEVKHWDLDYVDRNLDRADHEAVKLVEKTKRLASKLKNAGINPGFLSGRFLLTKANLRDFGRAKQLRGCDFYGKSQWEDLLNFGQSEVFDQSEIQRIVLAIQPNASILVNGRIRTLENVRNLEPHSPPEVRFHRTFSGEHIRTRDKLIVHLYDLSAVDCTDPERIASREFEAMQRLQRLHCVPRIMDSFQEVPHYPGELYFFSHSDPLAPTLQERLADLSWKPEARLQFATAAIKSLRDIHTADGFDVPFVHRNISPSTLRVVADNSAMYTSFELSRTSTSVTVCRPNLELDSPSWIAPEILQHGQSATDQRTDVYALSATLSKLFEDLDSELSLLAGEILLKGKRPNPRDRISLSELLEELDGLKDSTCTIEQYIPSWQYWSEGLVVPFRGSLFEVTSKIGDGGLGVVFAVQELESRSSIRMGAFAAKVLKADVHSEHVLRAYRRIRSISCDPSFATVFEVGDGYKQDRIALLVEKVSGRPLKDWISIFELCEEEIGSPPCEVAISWATTLCDALCKLHEHDLVHGDISPDNIIELEGQLTIIDFDLVQSEGDVIWAAGKIDYCPSDRRIGGFAHRSHDVFSLAATLFHVIFGKEPFLYEMGRDRELGPNWSRIDKSRWHWIPEFIDKATSPTLGERFVDAMDAAAWIAVRESALDKLQLADVDGVTGVNSTENGETEITGSEEETYTRENDVSGLANDISVGFCANIVNCDPPISMEDSQAEEVSSSSSQRVSDRIRRVRERLILNGHQQIARHTEAAEGVTRVECGNHEPNIQEACTKPIEGRLVGDSDFDAKPVTYDGAGDSATDSISINIRISDALHRNKRILSQSAQPSVATAAAYLPRRSWFALAQWAAAEGYLSPWERQFVYSLGHQRKRLTQRQLDIAEPLLEYARRHGFSE